jgi:II/X family phage/plasmid replication protein
MLDWITARIPCDHSHEIAGGAMVNYKNAFDFSQGQEWAFAKPLPIVGSHDSNVRVKTSGFDGETDAGRELHIDGNLVKFFQGHNLWGTHDLIGLVNSFMDQLCSIPQLGLRPTDLQRQMWRNGLFNLSRVDVTTMYQLRNRADVLSWLANAEHTSTMRHRGRGQLCKGSTL